MVGKSLLSLIDAYIEAYEALVKLSKEMYISLVNRDLSSLLKITNCQSEILSRLFMLGDSESFELEELKSFDSIISSLPLEERTKVEEKLRYLGELVVELKELVKINTRLLEGSIELLNKYMDFLRNNSYLNSGLLEERG
ncbi:flagellar export chaperone FlgN [bacterium]|nr:flagellar export chaperone FlgN [bacterium]